MSINVNIHEADMQKIAPCASIAIIGKRRTGKTTWAKYILQFINRDIDRFVALCGNKDNSSEWKRIIQPLYVLAKNLTYLQNLRDYQDSKVSVFTDKQEPIPRRYRICIILDDCGSDRTFMHSTIIKDILANGRHYGMTIVILCQYINQLHAENRDQIDYLCMLHTANQKNIRKIHEEYVNICEIRTFKYVLNACTNNRGCCWIDNTTNPNTVDECIFFKRIEWPIEFLPIGAENIRTYGNTHFHEPKDKTTTTISIDHKVTGYTDSDDSDNTTTAILSDIPQHILANQCTFTDKKGSVVVLKHNHITSDELPVIG